MWSDEFDKKINDAADHHLPPFREQDWNKMNMLLDKHLPEEKKKRRFMPLLFLLLGGFSMLIVLTTYKQAPVESPGNNGNDKLTDHTTPNPGNQSEDQDNSSIVAEPGNHYPSEQPSDNIQRPVPSEDIAPTTKRIAITGNNEKRNQYIASAIPTASIDAPRPSTESTLTIEDQRTSILTTDDPPAQHNQPSVTDSVRTTIEEKYPEKAEEERKKAQNEKGSKWQISFSTGPDLSLVGLNKTGDWKMQYGVGIGYSISNRIQIRTGFMVSRKLYYADSSDYNPPKGFWDYYPNLQKIDANCLVYEIPLNVVYSFKPANKHQWFVSGGLSSYLMKEETYEYYYKDPSGQDRYRERTISNENDHILSILHVSGGYQYKLSDKLSLMAEPYMKLPLGGVGFGKVKLNNTGVLFTVGYKPFARMAK
jgi:hypothetical protein